MSKIKIKDKLPIYGFMHCCAINNYKEIISEQVNKIIMSGLYHACDRISIGLLGEYDEEFWKDLPSKFHIDYKASDIRQKEFITLNLLYNRTLYHDCLTWYIHTKGVYTKKNYMRGGQESWRKHMENAVVINWRDCVRIIDKFKFNSCGSFLVYSMARYTFKGWHYSGNFWWARGDYVKLLKRPLSFDINHRWWAEKWILTGEFTTKTACDIDKFIAIK